MIMMLHDDRCMVVMFNDGGDDDDGIMINDVGNDDDRGN